MGGQDAHPTIKSTVCGTGILPVLETGKLLVNYINSGCAGIDIEDTAVPFPYTRLIVGKRHCRVLIVGSINSDATGIDITYYKL